MFTGVLSVLENKSIILKKKKSEQGKMGKWMIIHKG